MDKYDEMVVQFEVDSLIENGLMRNHLDDKTVYIDKYSTYDLQDKFEILKNKNQILYMKRKDLENNPHYRHLVCYVMVRDVDTKKVLCYMREKPGEERLNNMLSIGWGGHIRKDDFYDCDKDVYYMDTVNTFLERELNEELGFEEGSIVSIEPNVFLLYHNVDEVGSVHIGIIYIINVKNLPINVRSLESENIIIDILYMDDLMKKDINKFELWSKQMIEQRYLFE